MKQDLKNSSNSETKTIIKQCHDCGHLNESDYEPKRCHGCKKSFLPSNYFGKIHAKNSKEFEKLFSHSDELQEEELIRGLYVIW